MTNARKTLRWGIMGTGRIADAFVVDLARSGVGDVVAVGSRQQSTADDFAKAHHIRRAYGSYRELVRDSDVDVVYVATPHPMHFSNAALAIDAGKAALVEKAFTMTSAEARELVRRARANGTFLMEGMWTRFLPHIDALRKVLSTGALGALVSVSADHGQWFARDPSSRLFAKELGGSALLDLGVYVVSFASMVLGAPSDVRALIEPSFTGVDGQVSILLGHRSGAQAILNCTSSARTPTRAVIVGTEARIEISARFYAPSAFTVIPREGEAVCYRVPVEGHGLWYEAAEVARCMLDGELESPLMPLDESVQIMATMEEILGMAAAT